MMRAPLQPPTDRPQKDIVRTLLERLAEVKAEYPTELYEPRRSAYLAQLKTAAPLGKAGTAGSRSNGEARKAY